MPLKSGTTLGVYEVREPIGSGGMGEVYRARDTKLERDVAIKVLPDDVVHSPDQLSRFEREAQLLASLNHPNIATVHGLEEANGLRYLVMELVPGETLAEILQRGPIPVDDVVALTRQLIDGLEAAHENGVVHRDLKPANIKVTPDGVVRILDFGLAKAVEPEGAAPESSLSPTITRDGTQAGVILGTASYMSPEQARGKPVDKRSDIFSFGSVLFEMLAGKQAFDGEMVSDILAAVIKLEPDWTQLAGSRLDTLVRRCLEKDPRRRLRDIGDARAELEDRLETEPAPPRRNNGLAWIGAAAGVVAGVAATLVFVGSTSPPTGDEVTRFSIVLPPSETTRGLAMPNFALSPDGTTLVLETVRGLFVRHMDREEFEFLPGTAESQGAFFSPDGDRIGFIADGELKTVSLGGGPMGAIFPARIGDFYGSDWSTDGTIIFADYESGIWRVSEDGGEPELLVKSEGMRIRYPSLVGERKVVFTDIGTSRSPDGFEIVAASLETGERHKLGLRGTQPRYLQSGHLVFVDQNELKAVSFDVTTMTATGDPESFATGLTVSGGRQAALFDVSDSGTLAYLDLEPRRVLDWVDRTGTTLSTIGHERQYRDVRFSPDGQTVAIMDAEPGVDIWVYDGARDTFSRISSSPAFDEVPAWSPDGRFVTYTSSRDSRGRILHRRAADGSGPEEALWETPHHAHIGSWTSDGSTLILAETRQEGWDIFALNAIGEPRPEDLVAGPFNERNPRLDPTGRWLAYESDESGEYQVYVTTFPEPGARHLISSSGGVQPVWSADGSELFYRGPVNVWAAEIAGGASFSAGRPVALFPNRFERSGDHVTYDVHPDGRFLFVARPQADDDDPYEGLYRFRIVRNWVTELEARLPAP